MAQTNTPVTLDGLYKKVYGDKGPISLLPDLAIVQRMVEFYSAKRTGKDYNFPVVVSSSQGFTFGAADENPSLNTEIAATLKEVSVKGSQIVGQASISYEAAQNAVEGGEQAFRSSVGFVIQELQESHARKLEASLLYGRSGIATVASLAGQVITLQAASFADGLWMGMEGAFIDVYQSNGTLRQANLEVSVISPATYEITVVGTTTGIANTDVVFLKGAKDKECYGIDAIVTNTGLMFGVNAASYSLWKGNSYSAGSAALTMSKVLSAAAIAVARGGLSRDAVLLVHPSSFNNLNANEAALRQYVDDKDEAKNGFNKITYRGPNGKIDVVAHPMIKRGEAFLLDPKSMKRIGSTDITNRTPGKPSGEIFFDSQNSAAHILRTYSNQAILCEKPATMCKITGIVPA